MKLTQEQLQAPINGAPNFKLAELVRSSAADRLGISNLPTDECTVLSLEELARGALQPLRDALGVTIITSGYRSPAVNKAVGGSNTSWHAKGKAADITVRGRSLWEVFTWLYNNVPCVELIAEELPTGWIHVAYSRDYSGRAVTKYKLVGQPVRKASYEEIQKIFQDQGLIDSK